MSQQQQQRRNNNNITLYRRGGGGDKKPKTTTILFVLIGLALMGAGIVITHSLRLTHESPAERLDDGGSRSSQTVVRKSSSTNAVSNVHNNNDKAKSATPRRAVSEAGVTGLDDPALYQMTDLHGDSSTATVMGMASGYGLHVYERFVGSLRRTGYQGHIILGVAPDVSPDVLRYFEYRNVTPKILKWVDCTYFDSNPKKEVTTCSHPYPDIKIRWSRFPLARDWLRDCTTCTGPVLIMDVRDSYFQRDPFGAGSPPITGLQVFEEHKSQTTGHWLVKPIVQRCKGMHFIETMLCSGTTIGTRAAMLKYLEVMYGEMKSWITTPKCRNNMNGDDQTIHNYLYYTGQLPFATAIPNRYGIVNTVGVEGAKIFKAKRQKYMDQGLPQGEAGAHPYDGADGQTWIGPQYNVANADGMFTQMDGKEPSRVIHQYDRYGVPINRWISKQPWTKDPIPDDWTPPKQETQPAALPDKPSDTDGASKQETSRRRLTDAGVDVSDSELYRTIDLQGDSSTATVMGMATGYALAVYKRFVGSLRKSGFKGNIILGVAPDVSDKVLEYFESRNVTPKKLSWVECTYKTDASDKGDIFKKTKCSDPYPDIKIRWSRFPLQRDWLEECETCTGPVLIMDVRDSYFQLDPFGPGSGPITGLQVFEEHPSQTTGHWLVKPLVYQCKGSFFVKPMLCSGTTIGTRAAMIKYLEAMYAEMKVWINDPKCRFNLNGDDQTIHNYLYYTEQLPFANAIPNREGIVNTVGVEGAKLWHAKRKRLEAEEGLTQEQAAQRQYPGANAHTWIGLDFNVTDADGYFTQYDGTRSRVIHQYDRYGPTMSRWLQRQDFSSDK